MDIAGAVLIWKFGLPASLNREGQAFIAIEETDEGEIAKAKRYDDLSRFGLGLLIFGFSLQLLSNFL